MTGRPRGDALRRLAEATLDPDTRARIVEPALADLQHECETAPGAIGPRLVIYMQTYWGVLKAVLLCLLRDCAIDRDRTGRRLALRIAALTTVFVSLQSIAALRWALGFGADHGVKAALEASAFLLPQSLVVALPAALFFTVAMQRPLGVAARAPFVRSTIAGALLCATAVFALLMFAAPQANQSYRTIVFTAFYARAGETPPQLRRGLAEMTLPMLNDHIRHPPSTIELFRASHHRHQRFAFVAMIPVLGLLGLGLAGRWRSRVASFAAALALFVLCGVCLNLGVSRYGEPWPYGPWTATVAFLLLAVRLLRRRSSLETA
jgi:hypothetical protein